MKSFTWHKPTKGGACIVLEGGDPEEVKDRIAFIEKTPRVRIREWDFTGYHDWLNWAEGKKGTGPDDEQAREWCEKMLRLLGYGDWR